MQYSRSRPIELANEGGANVGAGRVAGQSRGSRRDRIEDRPLEREVAEAEAREALVLEEHLRERLRAPLAEAVGPEVQLREGVVGHEDAREQGDARCINALASSLKVYDSSGRPVIVKLTSLPILLSCEFG